MAENIFAISLADKCRIEEIDGTETVSCGRPIHGVDVKIVDGEIYVRSDTSLVAYIGGQDIRNCSPRYDGQLPGDVCGEYEAQNSKHGGAIGLCGAAESELGRRHRFSAPHWQRNPLVTFRKMTLGRRLRSEMLLEYTAHLDW